MRARNCCCCRRRSWCRACTHDGVKVWDTLAIGEYLHEIKPKSRPAAGRPRGARALPRDLRRDALGLRATCAAALPMNLKRVFPGYKVWARAQADIERITTIWRECLATYGGPFLFGKRHAWPTRCTRRWSRASSPTTSKLERKCAAYGTPHPRAAGDDGVDGGGASSSPTRSTNSTWSSSDARRGHRAAPGVISRARGPAPRTDRSTSTDVKSAGPTTSRYSMSGE